MFVAITFPIGRYMTDTIDCRYRGWRIRLERKLVDGRWVTSVKMWQPARGSDEEAVTLPFAETFATAPAAGASALEAAIIWIDRAGSGPSHHG